MSSTLIGQVTANCELANSLQAGSFSLCGLLLRLRLLYKWQHDLPPWREPEPEAVLAWIADQESVWDAREGEPLQELRVNGLSLDPFEVEQVNAFLEPEGLAYGAGFGRGLAPTFFLAELVEVRREDDLTILVLDGELARDLAGNPAMRQGSLIYARRQSLAYYLWDHLADPTQQRNRFLKAGWIDKRGLTPGLLRDPESHQEVWRHLVSGELEAVIRHEIGEARETSLAQALPAILELFPQTPLEHWIRALKDALADTARPGSPQLHHLRTAPHLPFPDAGLPARFLSPSPAGTRTGFLEPRRLGRLGDPGSGPGSGPGPPAPDSRRGDALFGRAHRRCPRTPAGSLDRAFPHPPGTVRPLYSSSFIESVYLT
jgi:hypothetical protein